MRPFKSEEGRLAEDPVGFHVIMERKNVMFLGKVQSKYFNPSKGFEFLVVKHMNGEDWPFNPAFCEVEVLEVRPEDYDPPDRD